MKRNEARARDNPSPVTFVSSVDTGEAAARNRACLNFAGDIFAARDVLDVGCWSGGFVSLIDGVAKSITAVDVEPAALAVARDNLPSAMFFEASVFDLPFEAESFDVVTLWAVLEHLPPDSEIAALREIRRVLRPRGYLAVNVPNAHPVAKALDPIFLFKGHRHYTPAQLEELLARSGFTPENTSVQGGILSLMSFIFFCFWKYLIRKPEPSWPLYRRACEWDSMRAGYVEVYALARKE